MSDRLIADWTLVSAPPKERCTVEILNGMGDLEVAEYVNGEWLAFDGDELTTRNPTHWRHPL